VSRSALRPTQPPIQWVPRVLSLGIKRPGREADHSPASNAEVKNAWSYTSVPQYASMAWHLVKHTDDFFYQENKLGRWGLDSSGSGEDPVARFCEHGNEPSVSI
jgi:hypothetical protein